MSNARVSVIVPAYNAAQFIAHALGSLVSETGDLDIIVVDDGSTDRTAEIVEEFMGRHPCTRLIRCRNGGVSRARNVGLEAVPPDIRYVTFLDADDHSQPGRIARQLGRLERDPDAAFVIGMIRFFEEIDEQTSTPIDGSRTLTVAGVLVGAALFRSDVLGRIGGFTEGMHYGEDTDLFLRLMEAEVPFIKETEVAVLYRRHASNVTNDHLKTRRGTVDAMRRSIARRRISGAKVDFGDFFSSRGSAEQVFGNG